MTFYKSCIIYVICSLLIGNFCYGSKKNKPYKIIVIGDANAGRTGLINQLMKPENKPEYYVTTQPSDNNTYEYKSKNGVKYNFEIWDTASKTQYKSTNTIFFKNANGIMAVYDITNTSSFNNLKTLIDEALKITGAGTPMIIAANNSEQYEQKQISEDEGGALAKQYKNAGFKETSANDHENVVKAFGSLFDRVIEHYAEKPIVHTIVPHIVYNEKKKKKTCSCCPCRKEKKLGDEDEEQEIIDHNSLLGT